jgi:hypothetical protein
MTENFYEEVIKVTSQKIVSLFINILILLV